MVSNMDLERQIEIKNKYLGLIVDLATIMMVLTQ